MANYFPAYCDIYYMVINEKTLQDFHLGMLCQLFISLNFLHVKTQLRRSLFAKTHLYATKFLLLARYYQWYLKELLRMMKGSYLFHKWFLPQSIIKSINVTQIENLMHYFLCLDTFDKKWNMKWHLDRIQISKHNDVTIAAFDEN